MYYMLYLAVSVSWKFSLAMNVMISMGWVVRERLKNKIFKTTHQNFLARIICFFPAKNLNVKIHTYWLERDLNCRKDAGTKKNLRDTLVRFAPFNLLKWV